MPGLKRESPSSSPALSYSHSSSSSLSLADDDDQEELEVESCASPIIMIKNEQPSNMMTMKSQTSGSNRKKLKVASAAAESISTSNHAANTSGGIGKLTSKSTATKKLNPFSIEAIMSSHHHHHHQHNHHHNHHQEAPAAVSQEARKSANNSPQTRPTSRESSLDFPASETKQQNQAAAAAARSQVDSSAPANRRSSTNHLLRPQVCRDPRLAPFKCHLDNLDLWHRFHPLDTEMIITKQGRRMFPPVRVTFSLNDQTIIGNSGNPQQQQQLQLNLRDKYQVLMDILPYDNKRYRYAYHKSSWQQAGKADQPSPTRLFLHPDGPFTLDQLKRQVISFEKIKLTNNDADKHGYIVLNSMHKYQPRIHLVLWRGKDSQNLANAPINQLEQETHKTFIFSETVFTAVTAYQNHSITKLKIDSNPFAKGFRDSSRLTDLELETMQDLITEGQCPFSPPRAPPHGFPHFLFAAAAAAQQQQQQHHHHHQQQQQQQHHHHQHHQQQQLGQQQQQSPSSGQHHHMGEDPASALLRERTIMALDSLFQQQQQSSGSPHSRPTSGSQPPVASQQPLVKGGANSISGGPQPQVPSPGSGAMGPPPHYSNPMQVPSGGPQQPAAPFMPFGLFLPGCGAGPQMPPTSQQPSQATTAAGQQQQHQPPTNFEQFLIQRQQQLAAAMAAAAAASSGHHPLHSLFSLNGSTPFTMPNQANI